MIEVDISNIWGEIALPDLLAMEKEVFDAHLALTEGVGAGGGCPGWMNLPVREETEEISRIRKAAEKIRAESDICLVVGIGGSCSGSRAAIELLRGVHYNMEDCNPQIIFVGDSLSTRRWNEQMRLLEGKDFSVIVVSKSGTAMEPAIAFRGLRWMMERKYGTDETNSRIYAITDPEQGALRQMAEENGWETFDIPADVAEGFSVLTAAGLLPLAVAGIDIMEIMNGAMDAKKAYDLRSYENPVWLYAAVRNLLYRSGKKIEIFESFEPDFRLFGSWWQQLFGQSGGGEGKGIFPVSAELTAGLYSLGTLIRQGERNLFETMVRFAPGDGEYVIGCDWKDLDGLNFLEGKTLDFLQEQAYFSVLNAHVDAGVPVIAVDCGALNPRTVGELFWFMELSCSISARVLGVNLGDESGYRQDLFDMPGKTGCED